VGGWVEGAQSGLKLRKKSRKKGKGGIAKQCQRHQKRSRQGEKKVKRMEIAMRTG